jgi:hypothetical protein
MLKCTKYALKSNSVYLLKAIKYLTHKRDLVLHIYTYKQSRTSDLKAIQYFTPKSD